ncbi:3-phosphoshikimate 1-carboxyvinyltransferase [Anaplasma platys]|uniref:3-phosphoshikimate 1-carboxyvinyltransferase n=1 Tax=Anaplasma platys TaxID=949 RepID=A0A858PYX2_9RICK|nr:hypothetical protein [Anaplasma platys]QJC27770.1 3-phosphoshikimate 1-carboxyvinyltransferase [Anaplasma platys]
MKCYTCRFVAADEESSGYLLSGKASLPGCVHATCVAMVIAAQSVGTSYIYGAPQNSDVYGAMSALRSLGIKINDTGESITIEGVGVGGFTAAKNEVCVGNSTYVSCVILGTLVTHSFTSFIFNKENECNEVRGPSLLEADINELIEIFAPVGAKFLHNNLFPLVVTGVEDIAPLAERRVISSHFVKSSLLLACMNIAGQSRINAHGALPAYTEWLLKHYGADVQVSLQCEVDEIAICGQKELFATDVRIFPSRTHVLAVVTAALLSRGASVVIPRVLVDKGMRVVLDILVRMGGDISVSESLDGLHRLEVAASEMFGVEITSVELRFVLEALPVLCIICAYSEGITRIFGASELPAGLRKSLEIVVRGLTQCGIAATMSSDLLEIRGCGGEMLGGIEVDASNDERATDAFLLLCLISSAPIYIQGLDYKAAVCFAQILNSLNKGRGNFVLESIRGSF